MPRPLHGERDIKLFNKGANRDLDKELAQLADGEYIDARNIRVESMQGESAVIRKINGEKELYPNIDNRCIGGTGSPLVETYECIGSKSVNGNIVEFWADADEVQPSLIRINGKIVLMSADFPLKAAYPLQMAVNESCIGGEIYLTDDHVTPMIFNVEDLMKHGGMVDGFDCSSKYFSDFELSQVLLTLAAPADHPVFIKLTSSSAGIDQVFGTGGVPVGYYSYQISYVTTAGDRTGWSVPTPQIPVMQRFTSQSASAYPYSSTHSKDPDVANPSPYGVHVRFRVNNNTNFDFIEVRRNRWNVGDVLTAPPISEVIGFVNITNGQIGIINILDNGAGAESVLSPDEAIESLSAVNKAKAIRYFNNRLYLANIEYASRDAAAEIEIDGELTADAVFPTIENMGKAGHKDPYRHTYNKAVLGGEKYGLGIVAYDENSGFSYARPIAGFENYQYPNRRDVASSLTLGTSYYGAVMAADVNGSINYTHEVFDTLNCVRKTDLCQFANILDRDGLFSASEGKLKATLQNATAALGQTCPIGTGGVYVTGHDVGYSPFTPVGQDDTDSSSTDMRINTYVGNVAGHDEYNPKGFGVDYFSLGFAVKGVKGLPSWAKSFSMVRTKAAQRVVGQGLGFYSLNTAVGLFGANTTKNQNKLWVYCPDLDDSIGLNPTIIDDIKSSLANYAVQCVSPLGFFTEVYSFLNKDVGNDEGADLITYCRLLKDLIGNSAEINPKEHAGAGINDGTRYYSAFGKWRNNSFNSNYPGAGNGNKLFDIADIAVVTRGRSTYLEITLTSSLYDSGGAGGPVNGDNPAVQDWHEPVYIVNIIRKNVDVPDTNVTEYIRTGHYQKVSSLIGVSDGSNNQSFMLVDERWEDCMQSVNGVQSAFNAYGSLYRFVFVVDPTGTKRRWLNVANLSIGTITTVLAALASSGFATVTDSSGSYTVYGVCTQSQVTDGTAPVYSIVFSHFDTSYSVDFFIPVNGYTIYVDYDERIPIRFFGGDSTTGEAICAFQDNKYNKNANPESGADSFSINLAFPYREYELNKRIYIVKKTKNLMAVGNFIQDQETFKFDNNIGTAHAKIRQLCAMFTCESRVNLVYSFNDEATKHSSLQEFPLKNYVMRPYRWDDDKFGDGATDTYDDNNIWPAYEDSYGNEFELWGYGGFRFLPQVNIDYSKEDNSNAKITSVPDVGFVEFNDFCTRVIWSLARPINAQNTPSVRTFPGLNVFDVSDDTGEIKYLYDETGQKGNSLFAFTERGLTMLLVDKRMLSEISGNELAMIGAETSGVLGQIWISKTIGMNDELWRSAAEFQDALFWCNFKSAYLFSGGEIIDIGRQGYHSKLYPEYLSLLPPGYGAKISAAFDVLHNEYWVTFQQRTQPQVFKRLVAGTAILDTDVSLNQDLVLQPAASLGYIVTLGGNDNDGLTHPVTVCLDASGHGAQAQIGYKDADGVFHAVTVLNEGECAYFVPYYQSEKPIWYLSQKYEVPTLVYSPVNKHWMGGFDYAFDSYLAVDNKIYGMRKMQTFELNKGFKINEENIEAEVIVASSKNLNEGKEFTRVRINSDSKPVKVEFFNNFVQALAGDVQAELNTLTNPLALKNYEGYEQYVPRKISPPHDRMQGRLLVFNVKHNTAENFKIASIEVESKKLK